MQKFCVFCGSTTIKDKTIEHIIPRRLIKLTGGSRIINLGIDPKTNKTRNFNIESFRFPACSKCNEFYGKFLEPKAENTIKNLLQEKEVNKEDIKYLLSWFDKIRIGLWLSFYYLNKNPAEIDPKFYINQRIDFHDRILIIKKLSNNNTGLIFTGTMLPSFEYIPSCFGLKINNLYFINISKENLISKNMGFPYMSEKEKDSFILIPNNYKRKRYPIFNYNFEGNKIEFYQTCFKQQIKNKIRKKAYNKIYIKNNCYNLDDGCSKIFFRENNNKLLKEFQRKKIKIKEGYTLYQGAKDVITIQNIFIENDFITNGLIGESRRKVGIIIKQLNQKLIRGYNKNKL